MRSHLSGLKPPYRLPSNVIYFHDWRYVQPGNAIGGWRSAEGESYPLFSPQPAPEMRYEYSWCAMPGLELRAIPASKTEPVIASWDLPIPYLLSAATVIHDEGRYRLWFEQPPTEAFGKREAGQKNLLRYAESDDGFSWRFPQLGLVSYQGDTNNNIVYGGPMTPDRGFHGGGVFKDPSAPPDERYKVFHLGKARGETLARYLRERPDDIEPKQRGSDEPWALFGAVSPDGFHWTPLPDPLVMQSSDTHNVCDYDVIRETYVGYVRTHVMQRRTIGRLESPDFRRFPMPEQVFRPGPGVSHTTLWYANAKTTMPGAKDYHVMFPKRWDVATDRFDFFLATSPDNVVWDFVPNGPVCEPGEPAGWDGESVAPGCGLVDLPGHRTGVLYSGWPIPHKHPRHPPIGALAWAFWEKDRLAALSCPAEGRFQTYALLFEDRHIRLNYRCPATGYIRIGVFLDGEPQPGRNLKDCDFLCGNELDRLVTWNGEADMGHPEGAPVTLRVEMRNAELFSIRFADQ